MDKSKIKKVILSNPNLTLEEIKRQAKNLNIPTEIIEEVWHEIQDGSNTDRLTMRLEATEDTIRQLEDRVTALESNNPMMAGDLNDGYMEEAEQKSYSENRQVAPKKPNAFFIWLKEDFLMKLGAFLLMLAMGWFVSYAFANNWIGPVGRISMGMILGGLIMSFGHTYIPKREGVGQVLVSTGAIMILITIFAARNVYDFFNPGVALTMTTLVVVAMAAIAIIRDTKPLAYMALLGGFLAPMLVDSPTPNYEGLMAYIFVLDIGVLMLAISKGWRGLILGALILTVGYSMALDQIDSDRVVWTFMTLFFGLFFASTTGAILHTKEVTKADVWTTGISSVMLLMWIYAFVPDEWQSMITSAITLLLAGVSYVIYQRKELTHSFYINASMAILFLGAATAFELSAPKLTVAYFIEGFIIFMLIQYFNTPKEARSAALIQALPMVMALDSLGRKWKEPLLGNPHFYSILLGAMALGGTSLLMEKNKEEGAKKGIITFFHVAFAFFFFSLIWLSLHTILDSSNTARGISLVIYILCGIFALVQGTAHGRKDIRVIGGTVIGLVILRLLFVEVWRMVLVARIITFVVIGVLLMGTAFLRKKS